jgi:2-polyprenyl-3-methyl-5-hydroxy-6-metoxy-1,4-benzoquinol methylase
MSRFQNRSNEKELLDGDDIPFADIRKNMQELNTINTILGGHAITLKGFKHLIGNRKNISVCEIGCGGGDNLVAIVNWCKKNGIDVHCTGIDLKKECIEFASQKEALKNNTHWVVSNYAEVVFAEKPDIIFSSLFCHHFTNETLVTQLRWMERNSRTGFFINDLHRHWLAYHSIRILTKLFSGSYLVKNDAPLSVARGFVKNEWAVIFQYAGIWNFRIQWEWAFRHLIIYQHDQ